MDHSGELLGKGGCVVKDPRTATAVIALLPLGAVANRTSATKRMHKVLQSSNKARRMMRQTRK